MECIFQGEWMIIPPTFVSCKGKKDDKESMYGFESSNECGRNKRKEC